MTIESLRVHQQRTPGLLCFSVLVCACLFASAAGAYAAPGVTQARFLNPVAYELKSLLSTRFTCNVDTAGTWGKLDVMGANGIVKTIYSGPLVAGTNWFPLWTGLDAAGRRLPSASYDWRLTVSKGGQSTVVRGKITVSRIHFAIAGQGGYLQQTYYSRYMAPGPANIYYDLKNDTPYDTLSLDIYEPSQRLVSHSSWEFDYQQRIPGVLYLRNNPGNDTLVRERGMHTLKIGTYDQVDYYFTVIQ